MENLVINDVNQLAHELQYLPSCLVCTSCVDYEKLKRLIQLCPNIDFAIGYQHSISTALVNLPLYSVENLVQKLEMEITLGTNGIKPAFIGVINFSQIDFSNQIWLNIIQSYVKCSETFGIPIIFDFQHQMESLNKMDLFNATKAKYIFLNPPVVITEITETNQISKQININPVYLQADIVYNLSEIDHQLYKLLNASFTPGIKYKTNLQQYGGRGFQIITDNTEKIHNLLKWATEIVQLVEIKMWKCPICQKEQPETEERFKKMGKEFCSMKCLRQGLS